MGTNLILLTSYHRGQLYLTIRKFIPKGISMAEWYHTELNVPYARVQSYILFSMLIGVYSGLIFHTTIKASK